MCLSIYKKTTSHSLENKIIMKKSVFISVFTRRHIVLVSSALFCSFIATLFQQKAVKIPLNQTFSEGPQFFEGPQFMEQ